MVSAGGFEPSTPGFIPLRLSPPGLVKGVFVVWTVSSPQSEDQGVARTVSTPSLRYSGGLGSGLARLLPERSPNLSKSTMKFPVMAPN